MTSLPEFLLARLAEEAWALDALVDDDPNDSGYFSPSRLAAECEARRRIVHEHGPETERTGWNTEETVCQTCRYDDGLDKYDYGWCPTLRYLGLPYSEHPEYRPEWKP